MSLPKISMPLFEINIPSIDKKVKFRPFLVKEEKILLIAQESKEEKDIISALKQIIQNCSQEEINIERLAYFDLEYLFLKLRAKSVSNIVEFKYVDPNDGETYTIKVNLNDVEIHKDDTNNPIIKINEEGLGLRLRFPSVDHTLEYKTPGLDQDEILTKMVAACIEDVFDSENVYSFDEYTPEQQLEFIDSIPVPAFADIQKFFDTIPTLRHEVKYKTKDKEEKTIVFEGLNDFFTWG